MNKPLETYSSMYDENGNRLSNRSMLGIFVEEIKPDGEFGSCTFADVLLCERPMVTFVVDPDFYQHVHKFTIHYIDGQYRLVLKNGEEYTPPKQETEKEKQIRLLKEQLAALENGGGMFDE